MDNQPVGVRQIMLKRISIRPSLLVLSALMTLMLLVVSIMGIIAINKGNRSLDVVNRIQGVELNNLFFSSNSANHGHSVAGGAVSATGAVDGGV